MRYWFTPEIEFFLKDSGFELIEAKEWMTGEKLEFRSWSVYFIAQR
jgi:hypothetical protein